MSIVTIEKIIIQESIIMIYPTLKLTGVTLKKDLAVFGLAKSRLSFSATFYLSVPTQVINERFSI